jgi:hypothetical protein
MAHTKRKQKKNRESGLSEKDLIIALLQGGVKEVKGLSTPQRERRNGSERSGDP